MNAFEIICAFIQTRYHLNGRWMMTTVAVSLAYEKSNHAT